MRQQLPRVHKRPQDAQTGRLQGLLSRLSLMKSVRAPPRKHESLLDRQQKKDGIVDRLQASSFGSFNTALDSIRSLIQDVDLSLPKLVVVGSRDAGKSSLLENITKWAVFPRDKGVCTKMPIKFHLQQAQPGEKCSCAVIRGDRHSQMEFAEDVLNMVTEVMKTVPNKANGETTFSAEELIIELKQVNVPTIDFIDLPGIQSVPEEARLQTEKLVKDYIKDSNTLVLCVLEATDSALDSRHALKVLTDANKIGSTIIALTKSDKVHEDDVDDQVLKRILLASETTSADLEGLQGCVAVVNRKHQDSHLTLQQAAEKEFQVFARMLHDAKEEYQTPAVQRQLASGMTSQQLMVRLNKMYHTHIRDEWVKQTLAAITFQQGKVAKSLHSLGDAPETLKELDVLAALSSKVDFAEVCRAIAADVSNIMRVHTIPAHVTNAGCDKLQLLQWAEECCETEAQIRSAAHTALSSHGHLNSVLQAYHQAFEADPQLKRLETFRNMLTGVSGKLSNRVTEALLEAKPVVDNLVTGTMQELLYTLSPSGLITTLGTRVSRCIVKHVIEYIKIKPFAISSGFQFTEDSQTARQRADFLEKLRNFEEAGKQIKNIEQVFSQDSHEDEVVERLLVAAKELGSAESPRLPLSGPEYVPLSDALYDDLDLHDSASVHAEEEKADSEGARAPSVASVLGYERV